MAHTTELNDGYCMRCSWPEYRTVTGKSVPVVTFYLGNFQARLCIKHARELIEELTSWSRDSGGGFNG